MYDEQSFNDASEQRQRLEKEFEKKKKKETRLIRLPDLRAFLSSASAIVARV